MDPILAFNELCDRARGRSIVKKRLFLYTLQFYFERDEAETGLEIWCEPSWHILGSTGVLTGSGAISFDHKAVEPSAKQRIVSEACDILVGLTLEEITCDARTHSLAIRFSNGISVETFLDDPDSEYCWHIGDTSRNVGVYGTPAGIVLEAV